MLVMMVNARDIDVKEPKNKKTLKKARSILKNIMESAHSLGVFLASVSHHLYSESDQKFNKKTQDFFTMCIILNSLLRSKYAFYCYSLFLSKIIMSKKKLMYLQHRQKSKTNLQSFDDLIYMKKFIVDQDSQNTVRCNSIQFLRSSSSTKNVQKIEQMTPKGLHGFLNSSLFLDKDAPPCSNTLQQRGGKVSEVQMDIHEFVVHLNLHLKMNLDHVFSSGLKEILTFFTTIEEFMEKTFGNKELEVKIDLMRLIIRMTNATLFIDKIVMLNAMRVRYLEYWQTFSLFTQVLLAELRSMGSHTEAHGEKS